MDSELEKFKKMIQKSKESGRHKEFFDNIRKKREDMESFFRTRGFDTAFDIIKTHDRIDPDSLSYGTVVIDGLDSKLFCKVVDTLMFNLDTFEKPDDISFSHDMVDYEGIRFTRMYGQGTAYWSEKL